MMTPGAISGLALGQEDPSAVVNGAASLAVVSEAPALLGDLVPISADAQPSRRGVHGLHLPLLGFADAASITLAVFAVLALFDRTGAMAASLAVAPLLLGLFKLVGLYGRADLRLTRSTLDEAPRLLQQTGLVTLGLAILRPVIVTGRQGPALIASLWIACFAAVITGRLLARWASRRVDPYERCLIVGDLEQAHRVRDRLAESRAPVQVIGCLPMRGADLDDPESTTIDSGLISELNVQRIIVVPCTTDPSGGLELIRRAKGFGVRVSMLPRILDVIGSDFEVDEINGMTLLGVGGFGLSASSRLLKRAFDIVLASIGVILIAPLISIIALAIRLDSRGPVFFRQTRVGRDGNYFSMTKFRSMVAEADALKDELRSLGGPQDGLFKIVDDPRVTRVGRLLRESSLDELPQIFNVLRGEMSLVGPRPLVVEEDQMVTGLERSRLHLTPGMTGPWQVLDFRLPFREMVQIDYRYVANWSLWRDVKILLRTISHVARRCNV